jgi:hypothetical protein
LIRTAGLDYDLIDDDALMITPPDRYRAVIIPTATMIMDATATWLGKVTAAGGSVIMINSTVHIPGAIAATAEGLADALAATVVPDLEISPPTPDIGFVHRRRGDADVYLAANTGPITHTFSLVARTSAKNYQQWDALTCRALRTGAVTEAVELTLHPYQATVIVFGDEPVNMMSAEPFDELRPALVEARPSAGSGRRSLSGPWRVAYGDEPAEPIDLPHIWEDQPGRRHYSGAATYMSSIDLGAVDGRVLIDFGECEVRDDGTVEHGLVGPSYRVTVRAPVREVAQVRVNGTDCGLAWAPPYRVEITDALRSGTNQIEITVYNTAANALAADEQITLLAAESEARYGRRFRMQDLDQAMDTVQSGLLRVPTIAVT